jgi:hypothetical protein
MCHTLLVDYILSWAKCAANGHPHRPYWPDSNNGLDVMPWSGSFRSGVSTSPACRCGRAWAWANAPICPHQHTMRGSTLLQIINMPHTFGKCDHHQAHTTLSNLIHQISIQPCCNCTIHTHNQNTGADAVATATYKPTSAGAPCANNVGPARSIPAG